MVSEVPPPPSQPSAPALDLSAVLAAERAIESGRYLEAVHTLERLLAAHGEHGALWVLHARAHFALGRSAQAARSAEEALRCEPTMAEPWRAAARALLKT